QERTNGEGRHTENSFRGTHRASHQRRRYPRTGSCRWGSSTDDQRMRKGKSIGISNCGKRDAKGDTGMDMDPRDWVYRMGIILFNTVLCSSSITFNILLWKLKKIYQHWMTSAYW